MSRSAIRPARCIARSGPASLLILVRQILVPLWVEQISTRWPGPSGNASQPL